MSKFFKKQKNADGTDIPNAAVSRAEIVPDTTFADVEQQQQPMTGAKKSSVDDLEGGNAAGVVTGQEDQGGRASSASQDNVLKRPGAYHQDGPLSSPSSRTTVDVPEDTTPDTNQTPEPAMEEHPPEEVHAELVVPPPLVTATPANDVPNDDDSNSSGQSKNPGKKWWIIGISAVVLLVGLILGLVLGLSGNSSSGDASSNTGGSSGENEEPTTAPVSPAPGEPTAQPSPAPIQPCTADEDCANKACALDVFGDPDRMLICCPSSKTIEISNIKYCSEVSLGQPCVSNEMCDSGICIGEMCRAEANNINQDCDENADCKNKVCAFDTLGDVNRKKVCCENGKAFEIDGIEYCSELPVGQPCADNAMCDSGLCIREICSAEALDANKECDESLHCKNKVCAFDKLGDLNRKTVCCENSKSIEIDSTDYCSELPVGQTCASNEMCDSGICIGEVCRAEALDTNQECEENLDCKNMVCAFDPFGATDLQKMCCESSTSEEIDGTEYCSGLKEGRQCTSNSICESGICIDQVCRAVANEVKASCAEDFDCKNKACGLETYGNQSGNFICCENGLKILDNDSYFCGGQAAGFACGSNEMCASGSCLNGTCAIGNNPVPILPAESPCTTNAQCPGGTCAYDVYDSSLRQLTCCASNGTISGGSGSSAREYCTGQAVGRPCYSNGFCESGICISGTCRAEANGANEACAEAADCKNRICAYDVYDIELRQLTCCESNETTIGGSGSSARAYCTGQAEGRPCYSDSFCESGICIGGTCRSEANDVNEACAEPADCKNRICAYDVFDTELRQLTCCESNELVYSGSHSARAAYCAGQVEGRPCASDSFCASGICIEGTCRSEANEVNEPCEEAADCKNRVCAFDIYDTDLRQLNCCEGDELFYFGSYSARAAYCGGQEVDRPCPSDSLCESGICIGGTCRLEASAANEPCEEAADCINRVCAYDTYDTELRQLTCCESNELFYFGSYSARAAYCGGQAVGRPCPSDDFCESGICIGETCRSDPSGVNETCAKAADCSNGVCAYDIYDTAVEQLICCESNTTVTVGSGSSAKTYCGSQAVGRPCPSNDLCESGFCIGDTCRSEANGANGTCDEAADCKNGVCAYDTYGDTSAQLICCEKNTTETFGSSTYCGAQAAGRPCPTNSFCESGICINDTCRLEANGANGACDEAADCENGICAYDTYGDTSAQLICCESNTTVASGSWTYCGGQAVGSSCPSNSFCESGICINETCRSEANNVNGTCDEDADCKNGVCGYDTYGDESAQLICCESNATVTVVTTKYCGDQPTGRPCMDDSLCKSLRCFNGTCA